MKIALAYVSVVLLWATTPLAIKWSGEGPGFLFAVTSRMAIGTLCLLLALLLFRKALVWTRQAIQAYCAVALQIYGAMMAVYWAAQFIPSGWISVISGLTPLMTAVLANFMLKEQCLNISKMSSYCLGIAGLYVMFGSALHLGGNAELGILGVLLSAFVQSFSAVWIKRIDAKLPVLSQVTGGLCLALPVYLISWQKFDGVWPNQLTELNILSILYLGIIATTFGFMLYYYLLTHLSATRVALISLTTPVMALWLGHLANREPLSPQTLTGTGLILAALLTHEVFDRINFRNFILAWQK